MSDLNGFATVLPSPSPTANYSKVFYVADPSVSGSLLFLILALAVSFFCVGLHELLRRYKSLHKILYTRVETCKKDAPEISSSLFGWISMCLKIPESFVIDKVGLDATMFLRFLRTSAIMIAVLTLLLPPILIPINFYGGNPSNITNIVLVTDGRSLSDIGLFRFSISNAMAPRFFFVHSLFVLFVTLVVFATTYLNYKSYAGIATNYRKDDGASSERPSWRKSEAVQLRTVIVQNVPPHLRTDVKLKQWFESLDIGIVESARLDTTVGGFKATRKLVDRRNRTLKKLERAYMTWDKNINAEKKKKTLQPAIMVQIVKAFNFGQEDFWPEHFSHRKSSKPIAAF
ncbi:late exocytosis, associated with Golgi transport-domain-containing protein [Chytridium lagenaria]|nr:late exocytosis, associated with Golgi transport-domain-containing protein [Chytridium lagenaria]